MNDKAVKAKKSEVAKAREGFLNPMKLEDIHYNDSGFFPDIVLWGIRPIRLIVDSVERLSNGSYDRIDTDGANILLNEVQIRLDNLIDHFDRWEIEEINSKRKQEVAEG